MSAARPEAVLFACNLNSVRSPMAAALARRRFGDRMHVESCGVGAGGLDPFAAFVMDELGMDIEDHESQTFADLQDGNFDLIISLTPEAHERALTLVKHMSAEAEFWPIADPSLDAGSREQRLDRFREIRNDLDRRIAERFAPLSTNGD